VAQPQRLFDTSPYADQSAPARHVDSTYADTLRNSTFSVRTTPYDVPKILQGGQFLSQHHTGDSGGSYDPDYRTHVENKLFPQREAHPIYGYMRDQRDPLRADTEGYGEVEFNFSDRATRDQLTVTPDDSLGSEDRVVYGGSPPISPDTLAEARRGDTPDHNVESWGDGKHSPYIEGQYHPTGPVGGGDLHTNRQGLSLQHVASVDLHDSNFSSMTEEGVRDLRESLPGVPVRRVNSTSWIQDSLADHDEVFRATRGTPGAVTPFTTPRRGTSAWVVPDDDLEYDPTRTGFLPKKGER
jgi:hypothetical protein